ncbi:malonate transporter subunit MadL [Massilia sp. LXY-6]|uniref:malonate transporter subunit MadL n=1 Tax=Massilia sp. LXY-6 TaxID=3379823 RepID=UPI003EDE82DC
MIIYGTALLAVCHLLGIFLGDLLGALLGVKTNVGGVGIAMILLICARLWLHKRGLMPQTTEMGVGFWGAMYIPVVVAMAATQNVLAALRGGPVAVLAAAGSVLVCACFVSMINRTERQADSAGETEVNTEADTKARVATHRA